MFGTLFLSSQSCEHSWEIVVSTPPGGRKTPRVHERITRAIQTPGLCLAAQARRARTRALKSLQYFLAFVDNGNYSYRELSPEELKALYRRCRIDSHNMNVTERRSKHCHYYIDEETSPREGKRTFGSVGQVIA